MAAQGVPPVRHIASLSHTPQHFADFVALIEPQGRLALIDDFEARVTVAPSLKAATSFVVKGDWTFDRPVVADGDVTYADLGRPCVAGVDDPA